MIYDSFSAGRLRDYLDERLAHFSPLMRSRAEAEDPIGLVYPYSSSRREAELVALLVSTLSYGQRKVFVPLAKRLLDSMGKSPYDFIMDKGYKRDFSWFRYRFNDGNDISCLLYSIKNLLDFYGSLESAFMLGFLPEEKDSLLHTIAAFSSSLRGFDFSPCGLPPEGSKSLGYLIPNPYSGGACKRLNMFLRWMFRKDEVDLGIWSGVPLSRLIIPLDTHVGTVSLALGLTSKKSSKWQCAEDITESLLQLDSKDPLKYDFLLFSMGFDPVLK